MFLCEPLRILVILSNSSAKSRHKLQWTTIVLQNIREYQLLAHGSQPIAHGSPKMPPQGVKSKQNVATVFQTNAECRHRIPNQRRMPPPGAKSTQNVVTWCQINVEYTTGFQWNAECRHRVSNHCRMLPQSVKSTQNVATWCQINAECHYRVSLQSVRSMQNVIICVEMMNSIV